MWGSMLLAADAKPSMPAAEGHRAAEGILRRGWGRRGRLRRPAIARSSCASVRLRTLGRWLLWLLLVQL